MRDPAKVVWLSQTTLSVDETVQTVAALRDRFPQLIDPPSDDICYATQNRQTAVKAIAPQSDVVIVVGSPNSSNSVRLVEVAKDAGARAAYLVDDAGEVDAEWLRDASTVGVTSGASVPEELVAGVHRQARRARVRRRGGDRGGQGADDLPAPPRAAEVAGLTTVGRVRSI